MGYRFLVALTLLIYSNAFAFNISDDICRDYKCRESVNAIQNATLHEVGFYNIEQQFLKYGENRLKFYLKKYNIEREVATGFIIYNIIKNKEIRYKNVTLGIVSIKITYNF